VLSAVEQTPFDPARWTLEVDVADAPDAPNLTFTLLHEFGHLLTLSPAQVPPNRQVFLHPYDGRVLDGARAACPNYFPGEGCSLPGSYLNVFFERYWRESYGEWQKLDRLANPSRRDAALESFYERNRERFVDSYAATSPPEDIAESWAYFLLSPRPSGDSQRDQKLRFFYEYPELVSLRSAILSNLCAAIH
jgi:hypothetical protein